MILRPSVKAEHTRSGGRDFGLLTPLLVVGILLGIWQFASDRYVSSYFISSPVQIFWQIVAWAADGTLVTNLLSTTIITLSGFAIAAVTAIPLALIVSASPTTDSVLQPYIYAAYAMPKIVLAPAFVLWLGIGGLPAICLSSVTAFFLIFYNVYVGLKEISPTYGILARLLDANALQSSFKFRLPAAGPYLATGLTQGLVYAFHGAMVGEMTASNVGIGYLILYSGARLNSTGVLAALVLIGAIAWGLTALLNRIVSRFGATSGDHALA